MALTGLLLCFCSSASFAQETQIKGFANIDYGVRMDTSSTSSNSFHLGQYDMFITSQVTDRISFLGESVFEHNGSSFGIDVERVILRYKMTDYFNISAGKYHTPLGYWNNAYHHGEVIQPTIGRPYCLKFEDEGGPLPIHETGVMIDGSNITKLNFGYNVLVSNGIGATPISDNNTKKSISANLYCEPIDNFRIFVSGLTDAVTAGTVTLQGAAIGKNTNYSILNFGMMYINGAKPFEAGGEFYSITTKQKDFPSSTSNANAAYFYLGYKIKKIVPYFRYDMITYDKDHNYFAKNNLSAMTFGMRYKMTAMSCVKLEYQMLNTDLNKDESSIKMQFAVGF